MASKVLCNSFFIYDTFNQKNSSFSKLPAIGDIRAKMNTQGVLSFSIF